MSVLAGSTLASRLLGLWRDSQQAAFFGMTEINSAFYWAFGMPNLFRRLLGEGSLTAAFVPTLHDELAQNSREGVFKLLNTVSTWLLIVTSGLVAIAMAGFSCSRIFFPAEAERWYLGTDLTVILFPYLVFICLAAAFSATLQAVGRFTEQSFSRVFLNLSMIVALGIFGRFFAHTKLGQVHWLCAGVLVGGFLQATVPAIALMREGWRPRFDFSLSPRLREIARLMAPGVFGAAIYQINIQVSRWLAFSLNDSGVSALFLANRVMEVPIGIFAIAVSTVSFHSITRHANNKDYSAMSRAYEKGQRLILTINIPAAVGLVLLSQPIVRLLFQRGAFKAEDTATMAPVLAVFALGMPFFSAVSQITRAFYAMKDMKTPVRAATLSFVVNIVLSFTLMKYYGTVGLALASNLAIVVQTIYLQTALNKRLPGVSLRHFVPNLAKIALGTVVMGLIVWAGWQLVQHAGLPAKVGDGLAIFGIIPIAVAAYAGLLWLLKIEGAEDVRAIVNRVTGGKK